MYRVETTTGHSEHLRPGVDHIDLRGAGVYRLLSAVLVAGALVATGQFPATASNDIVPVYEGRGSSLGTPLSSPMGIFFDRARNECYVADTGNHQVVVFDGNGLPTYRFYHYVEGAPNTAPVPGEPRSVAVAADGTIFIVDAMAPYIDVTDPRGRSLRHIEVPADDCGMVERFEALAMDAHGTVHAITACATPRVAIIEHAATVSRTITLQRPAAERVCVTGIAVDAAGRICITDPCGDKMVQIYSTDGAFVSSFGAHDAGFENFSFAAGIAAMDNGSLWIADSVRQVASQFTHEGRHLATVGGKGTQPGAFEYPSAVATDGASRVFVLERKGNRYQCFQLTEGASTSTD